MRMLRLESFTSEPEPAAPNASDHAIAAVRSSAYEEGYANGWQEAQLSQAAEIDTLKADALRHLQDLSFTFHDARAHVLRGMGPFVIATVAQFLPTAARLALPALLAEALKPYWDLAADSPVQLETGPDTLPLIEDLLNAPGALPCAAGVSADLAEGQIRLRLGANETSIDTQAAITQVMTLIETFFAQAEPDDNKETAHD